LVIAEKVLDLSRQDTVAAKTIPMTAATTSELFMDWRRGWDSNRPKPLLSTTYSMSETLKAPESLKTSRVGTIQER
jgi:hypothetical protein